MTAPVVAVQITDLDQVDEAELGRRLARVASLSPANRAGRVVLVRDPRLEARRLVALARRLREATRAVGARLWVNDRLDVAALVEADGVHLGRRSASVADARQLLGDRIVVSVACHDVDEVLTARARGADACTLSPIFDSPGKGPPLGLAALRSARERLGPDARLALIALGGIDASTGAACLEAGADAVAAIRADVLSLPLPRA